MVLLVSRKPAKKAEKNAERKAAKKPGKGTPPLARDDGEDVTLMEPMRISEENNARMQLSELVLELTMRSAAFKASLPDGLALPLADYVRSMNCYYSNLIEGHNTHPVDIEKALHNDLSKNAEKRDLQLEAKAHIEVQRWIDEGGLAGNEMTTGGILEIHRRFIELLPEQLRWVEIPGTGERIAIVPGKVRTRDAKVGDHIAMSPGAIDRFLARFEARYANIGNFEAILSAAAAHHRLLFIHPFSDGNGRVARLMSYATLLKALGTSGLWSVARGLARSQIDYKKHLAECDVVRRGDRDGRGNLSESALNGFTKYFLETCIDQVKFMDSLMQPRALRDRILAWANEEIKHGRFPAKAPLVLDAILFRGSLPRGEVASVIGQTARSATSVTNALSSGRDNWGLGSKVGLASCISREISGPHNTRVVSGLVLPQATTLTSRRPSPIHPKSSRP